MPSPTPPSPPSLLFAACLLAGVRVAASISCEEAQMKCAYREGCGGALQHYLTGCSAVLEGAFPQHRCPEVCQRSLVALISTEQGKELMECECSDQYCETQKRRTEVCRPIVFHTMSQPVVACRIAEEICSADAACSNALFWYHRYCKAMFVGRRCSARCRNSINILKRQEKASRLTNCRCDHDDDLCRETQTNLHRLCFKQHPHHGNNHNSSNTIHHKGVHHPPETEDAPKETEIHEETREEEIPTVILASGSSWNRLSCSFVTLLVTVALVT